MSRYRRLSLLPQSLTRDPYLKQGPSSPYALSELLGGPSTIESTELSAENLTLNKAFDKSAPASSYFSNSQPPLRQPHISTQYIGNDGKVPSPYEGHDIGGFTNSIPDTEFKTRMTVDSLEDVPNIGENPKFAIRHGLIVNLPKLLPHLIAISATLAVVQFSFRNHYWMDLVGPTKLIAPALTQSGALNLLQFAAKIHELLILASLTTIMMHAMRSHILGRGGLPFGLIASGFQIFSGDWIRRKSFWAAWSPRPGATGFWNRFPFIPFLALFMLSSLLATLAGPSSAIAIVPSLNWFPLKAPFNTTVHPFFVFNQSTALWPKEVTADSINSPGSDNNCTYALDSAVDACPAGGFSELYAWTQSILFQDFVSAWNISFEDARGQTRRIVSTETCDGPSSFSGKASAMSLNQFFTGALTTFWTYAQNNLQGTALSATQPRISPVAAEIFAPRTNVICEGYDYNVTDTTNLDGLVFPALTNDSHPDPKLMRVPEWTWNYERPMNASNFTFVQVPEFLEGPSIAAVYTVPVVERTVSAGSPWYQGSNIIVCSIYAQWAPVDGWYEPKTDDQVAYTVADDNPNSCLNTPKSALTNRVAKNLTIDPGYADAINMPIDFVSGNQNVFVGLVTQSFIYPSLDFPGGLTMEAPFNPAISANEEGNDQLKSRCVILSAVLAAVVTDSLSRIAGGGVWPYSTPMFVTEDATTGDLTGIFPQTDEAGGFTEPLNTTAKSENDWLRLDMTVERYGYGYQWRTSKTVQFGISVLLVHVAMASAHFFYVLYKIIILREGVGSSWDQIGELIALALNSKPTRRMEGTSAGVEGWKTWAEIVAVRERSEGQLDGHLELVVGQEEVFGWKRQSIGGGTGKGIPQADKKYA